MRRRYTRWLAWAAIPVLLVVADLAYWSYASRQLQAGFQAWLAQQRAAGWTIRTGPLHAGGWPVAATLRTGEVSVTDGAAGAHGGLRWHSQHLLLRVPLLHPQTLTAYAGGLQHVQLADGPVIPFTAERLRAVVPLDTPSPGDRLHIRADGLRAGVPAGGQLADLAVGRLNATLAMDPTAGPDAAAASFAVSGSDMSLPPNLHWALGAQIARVSLQGTLSGPLRPAPDLAGRAAAWQQAGGALRLQHFGLHWGPLDLTGAGTVSLDGRLQPTATATLRIAGYAATLDRLARENVLSHPAVTAAKAVLSLMAQPAGNAAADTVQVPVTLQDGTLSVQRMPLLRVPPLDWPAS